MQTFLPYHGFKQSAESLDNKRLNKQITEGRQILDILIFKPESRWRNHPAILMWKGYEYQLFCYICACYDEWKNRLFNGKRNGVVEHKSYRWIINNWYDIKNKLMCFDYPPWIGNDKFHRSHRSNLLRKNKEHYDQFDWKEPDNLPYFWPSKEGY